MKKEKPVHSEIYNGINIKVLHDPDAPNPRTESDNLGHMVYWHRKYNIGDIDGSKKYNSPREFLDSLPKGSVVLPMFLMDHSNLALRTTPFNDPWDSGQVGHIYATPDEIRKEYGVRHITRKTIETVKNVLKAEIKEFGCYMNGEVFGYVLEDEKGDELGSCWGYYGEEYCLEEAKAAADNMSGQNIGTGVGR